MNFDRLTNISKGFTVGEINQQPLRVYDRNCHKYGRLSQTVSSRLDYNSIFNDQKTAKKQNSSRLLWKFGIQTVDFATFLRHLL